MAMLNGNNAYLEWDGVRLDTYFVETIDVSETVGTEDITMGSGVEWTEVATKLKEMTIDLSVGYDVGNIDLYKAVLETGKKATLIYGPEGKTTGKPKLEGTFMLTDVNPSGQSVDKSKVMISLSFRSSGTPTSTLVGALAGTFV